MAFFCRDAPSLVIHIGGSRARAKAFNKPARDCQQGNIETKLGIPAEVPVSGQEVTGHMDITNNHALFLCDA